MGEPCYKVIQWSQLLQGVSEVVAVVTLHGVGERCYKRIVVAVVTQSGRIYSMPFVIKLTSRIFTFC